MWDQARNHSVVSVEEVIVEEVIVEEVIVEEVIVEEVIVEEVIVAYQDPSYCRTIYLLLHAWLARPRRQPRDPWLRRRHYSLIT
jgi:hypothetical protein